MERTNGLKECPFCGCEAEILRNKEGHTAIACTSTLNENCFLYSGHDERIDNNANWDDVMTWYTKVNDAIFAWNRRAK